MRAKIASKPLSPFMTNPTPHQTNPVIIIFALIGLLTAAVFAYWGFLAAEELKDGAYDYNYESSYLNDDIDYSNDLLIDDTSSSNQPTNNNDLIRLQPINSDSRIMASSTNSYEGLEDQIGTP